VLQSNDYISKFGIWIGATERTENRASFRSVTIRRDVYFLRTNLG
jgi:hypothetical protein